MEKIIIALIALFIFCNVQFAAEAKSALTKEEKAHLQYKHSIIKKSFGAMKKSTLKSIQAKLKDKEKSAKKIKAQGGY
jgi:hypothetical protein